MALILDRTPTSSPISNLPSDILWRIFYLNAVMDPKSDNDIPALHTLRHTSQVCGLWRTLSLGSPSLWARVINLGYLEQSQEWRDEVVGRTGQADLDIIATHTSMVFSTKCFVSTFVKKHWPRIRSLNVKMFSVDPPSDIKNWNDIAHRPSGLRHLTIQAPPTIIFGFLDSISLVQFPLLENLEICEIHSFKHLEDTDYDSFPPASLPRLRRLKITSPLQVNGTLHFLEKVVPAEDCVLDFAGSTSDDSATQQLAVDIIPRVLPKYLVCAAGVQDYSNNTAHAILTNKCIGFSSSNTSTFPWGAIDPDSFSFRLQESDVSIIPELPIMLSPPSSPASHPAARKNSQFVTPNFTSTVHL
ncbi:hypothetical protein CPB84DRAFT_1212697 [Gymnopilus junonius]|uniref:F-box domain-containing protein n=1 Tax=Gymnopilus junonius TaxID=109634 RepID=A0A9P5NMM7_GYMJU|nr:hypothetical protein CPB84DRAFT_1212697 [Gymnopilus junonius]